MQTTTLPLFSGRYLVVRQQSGVYVCWGKLLNIVLKGGLTVGLLGRQGHIDLDGEDEESPCGGEKTGYGISVEIVQQPKK